MSAGEGTPMARLKAAVLELDRAEQHHAEKKLAADKARQHLEQRDTEEAHAAKQLQAAHVAVKKAARELGDA